MVQLPCLSWRLRRLLSLVPVCVVMLCMLHSPAAHAQWRKLSIGQSFSDVGDVFRVSPDGRYAVYLHDAETDEAVELYSVPLGGGAPVRLSGMLPSGSQVADFMITHDGSRVIYIAPQDSTNLDELYVVDITGGDPLRLNANFPIGASGVESAILCDDQSRVVYRADQSVVGQWELNAVPVTGGAPVSVSWGDVHDFRITADCTQVVFTSELFGDMDDALFSAPIGGGTIEHIGGILDVTGIIEVLSFVLSPDSARAVYISNQDQPDLYEVYSVPVGGGTTEKLNGTFADGSYGVYRLAVSPDGGRIVYLADQESAGRAELFSVPTSGGAAAKLNTALPVGGGVTLFNISPDSSRVVYMADQQVLGVSELYSVPIADGAVTKLNGDLVSGGGVKSFVISPDSQWVVYRADQHIFDWIMGYRVPLAGPSTDAVHLWSMQCNPGKFRVQDDSGGVVILGQHCLTEDIVRLWHQSLTGEPDVAAVREIVPVADFHPEGAVGSFVITPDSAWTVYSADQIEDDVNELFVVFLGVFADGFESGDTSSWTSETR